MELLRRILFALKMSHRFRKPLIGYRTKKSLQIKNIFELSPLKLKEEGYKVVVFDYDGVLAAHGENKLSDKVADWLKNFVEKFGMGKVFILSNKPSKQRVQYFSNHFKGIEFIFGKRKKPYPDGILQILQITEVPAGKLLMVDDRLLTGILAAILANVRARYLTDPMINYHNRPITEIFIQTLRKIERFIL